MLIAANPDPDSRLPYLLRLPLGGGMVFRTAGTWPRTSALYCHPVPPGEWPETPDIVERVPLRSCAADGLIFPPPPANGLTWCCASGIRWSTPPAAVRWLRR